MHFAIIDNPERIDRFIQQINLPEEHSFSSICQADQLNVTFLMKKPDLLIVHTGINFLEEKSLIEKLQSSESFSEIPIVIADHFGRYMSLCPKH